MTISRPYRLLGLVLLASVATIAAAAQFPNAAPAPQATKQPPQSLKGATFWDDMGRPDQIIWDVDQQLGKMTPAQRQEFERTWHPPLPIRDRFTGRRIF